MPPKYYSRLKTFFVACEKNSEVPTFELFIIQNYSFLLGNCLPNQESYTEWCSTYNQCAQYYGVDVTIGKAKKAWLRLEKNSSKENDEDDEEEEKKDEEEVEGDEEEKKDEEENKEDEDKPMSVSGSSRKSRIIYFGDKSKSAGSIKWIINDHDVSTNISSLRQRAFELAEEGQILSDHHFLLLNHVVNFDSKLLILQDLGLEDCCSHVKRNISRRKFSYSCSDETMLLCRWLLKKASDDDEDEADFEVALIKKKIDAIANKKDEQLLMLNLFGVFFDKLSCQSVLTEQSYIESSLLPLLDAFFASIPGTEHLSTRGQLERLPQGHGLLLPIDNSNNNSNNNSSSSSRTRASGSSKRSFSSSSSPTSWFSLFPDYLVKIVFGREKFDVLAVEVKKPKAKSSQIVGDTAKLGNMLKLMLDNLVLRGVPSPVVCGFVDDGEIITTYKMTMEQEGRYDLVELASFPPVRCLDDLLRLPSIIDHFEQLKNIVFFTKEAVRVARLKEKILGPLSLGPVVPIEWLRPSFEYPGLEPKNKRQK